MKICLERNIPKIGKQGELSDLPLLNVYNKGRFASRKRAVIMLRETQGTMIEVSAYSGYRANERPLYFVLECQRVDVEEILDRWYGEDYDFFKILGNDGRVYLLKWHRALDTWFFEKILER